MLFKGQLVLILGGLNSGILLYLFFFLICFTVRFPNTAEFVKVVTVIREALVVVVLLLFNVYSKQLWSCEDGQFTLPHFSPPTKQ